ncbi:MAG: hypothetical protein WCO57_01200 [Verrucomicrobiota bacterium]
MRAALISPFLLALFFTLTARSAAADDFLYFPATPDNTALADGTALGSEPITVKRPDFAARRRAIWGGRVFCETEIAEMKAYELEGQEG